MRTSHRSPIVLGLVPALTLVAILLADGAATGAPAGSAAVTRGPAASGSAGGADREGFSETTEVTAVEIPVQVIRDGEPVRGLTAADFELYEGRKQQVLTGFDVVDLSLPENQRLSASIPAAGRRHFLLVFDLSNSDPKRMLKAREAVKGSLLTTLVPSDLVAVATYGGNSGLKLALGFTSDRRQLLAAIDRLGLADLTDRMQQNPYLMAYAEISDVIDQSAGQDNYEPPGTPPPPGLSRHAAAEWRAAQIQEAKNPLLGTLQVQNMPQVWEVEMAAAFASESLMRQRTSLDAARNALMALTKSFSELARMMDAVSGRKLVVYFSQGFDDTILQGVEDIGAQQSLADATMHGLGAFTDSDERYGRSSENNRVERMLEVFRRSGCVIESVDIGGLTVDQDLDLAATRPMGEAALFQMAHDTGGELFHNFNDLGEAMKRLAQGTSLTYLLTFQPQGPLAAGSFHKIEVKLKHAPRGARVTYKTGYYAPRPYSQQRPVERILASSDQLMSGAAGGSIATAVLVAPFRAATARAYVPVVIEADGATLLAGNGPKIVPAEIYVYAVDAEGTIRDYFDQTLQVDVDRAGKQLRQGGLKYFGHLELPPGEYAVRVLLRNGATGAYGRRSTMVNVPAFGGAEPVLLPPLFPEASGRWTVVREAPRGQQKDATYPFTVGQRAYMPAALPTLHPGEAAAVALVGYNLVEAPGGLTAVACRETPCSPAGERLEAQARVQSADGRDVGGGDLRLGAREPGGDGGPEVWKAVFRAPQGLAPGQYRLIVTVNGNRGTQTGTTLFTVAAPAGNPG
ncbi:MAG TPA: VWA domain-containing protein [Thermoanaerobaculia bacterium]